eukprot:TRINITY_DN1577_c0_g1_i2.p1 TRINITY_DN1577_c0_g1~~TRINITY_DN1577_c0_g1_i2.p1  ORF type:complete len:437 (-),score=179.18 TRINITY_DN1577_c0_g1_i2:338-1648(-)
MARQNLVVVALLLLAVGIHAFGSSSPLPGSPETHHLPVETHHSISHPFDAHAVYWKYGGATVVTNKFIRLTPATQDRRGWLWNDFPVESQEFEVEMLLKITSKSHFGGDGFGFWILHENMDPLRHDTMDWLNGPVFGLRPDFNGFGVLFDTYDNDMMRDNPTIFAVRNAPRNKDGPVPEFSFNHNSDFSQDMLRDSPSQTYKCTADYRNLVNPFRVLVRYQRQILHVYVDKADGSGYQFCLAVNVPLPEDFRNHYHIAFTGMTGQLADYTDLLDVKTHYLDKRDAEIQDSSLHHVSDKSWNWALFFWILILIVSSGLTGLTAFEVYTFHQLKSQHINAYAVCEKVNALLMPSYALHFVLTGLFLITAHWFLFLFNLPLALYRLYSISKNSHRVDADQISDDPKVHGGVKYTTRLYVALVFFVVSVVYYFYRLVKAT